LTKEELAELLGTTRQTLNNWEKEKPDLVRLINQGLALDESIEETKKHLERLEQIKNNASCGKFNLKGK
jgi:transcriptional regulator with XRE-family HTH domain